MITPTIFTTDVKILLDTPSATPGLDYPAIADALASVIRNSSPQFAVGLFGGWGSGKTTLMRAIRAKLEAPPATSVADPPGYILVEFNAWRFEREPLLLVPLLDTIRAAVAAWSTMQSADALETLRTVTSRIGRVIRALASGVSAEVGLPGAVKVSYDMGKAMDEFGAPQDQSRPQSLYLAAFNELTEAFESLHRGGVDRVVVFVDDLDRCLPGNALDVLESMKLFFDLPGFVFVVGLDQEVVERAVSARYAAPEDSRLLTNTGSDAVPLRRADRLSRDYVKKIFQVPYSLPPVVPELLDALLLPMYLEAQLGQAQLDDLNDRVRPHLGYIAVDRTVNPREVKRYINNYTLQTLVRPHLDRDTVLAVQTLAFRYEWEFAYEAMLADSSLFIDALSRYRGGEGSALDELDPRLAVLPTDLIRYLRSPSAEALTRHSSLDAYISSVESSTASSLGGWLVDAYRPVGRLRRELRRLRVPERVPGPDAGAFLSVFREVEPSLVSLGSNDPRSDPTGRLPTLVSQIQSAANLIPLESDDEDTSARQEQRHARIVGLAELVDQLYLELQILRTAGR